MTHNMDPELTKDIIEEIRKIVKSHYTTKLEEFTLFLSGGNQKLFRDEEKSRGTKNISAIEEELRKIHKIAQHIHTLQDTYNILILDLLSEPGNQIRTFPITQEGQIYDEKRLSSIRKEKSLAIS